jgi:hypothetical protein
MANQGGQGGGREKKGPSNISEGLNHPDNRKPKTKKNKSSNRSNTAYCRYRPVQLLITIWIHVPPRHVNQRWILSTAVS